MQAREPIVSISERQCVHELLLKRKRFDGRKLLEFRSLSINFTEQLGGCVVDLGETKVYSQVSCDIAKPRPTRPNEGLLNVNLEFSPIASPSFEAERWNELSVEANRVIERCLVDSRCLDMESLCIISGEVVWEIKLDIRVLNHEGNLIDACCVSAISALCHFQRPDVTVYASEEIQSMQISDQESVDTFHGRMKFHSSKEKALVSLNIQHLPVCVTLCFYDQGRQFLVDPTKLEEMNLEGKMVVAVNNQKEVCTLHLSCGGLQLTKEDFLSHVHKASTICSENLIVQIKEQLKANEELRKGQTLQKQLESRLTMDHTKAIAPVNQENDESSPQCKKESKSKASKKLVETYEKKKSTDGQNNVLEEKSHGDYDLIQQRKDVTGLLPNGSWSIKMSNMKQSKEIVSGGFISLNDEAERTDHLTKSFSNKNCKNLKLNTMDSEKVDDEFSEDENESVQVIV